MSDQDDHTIVTHRVNALVIRNRKLQAEVARLKTELGDYESLTCCDCCSALTDDPVMDDEGVQCQSCTKIGNAEARAEAAEATLRAVGELPKYPALIITGKHKGRYCDAVIADELDALLKEE